MRTNGAGAPLKQPVNREEEHSRRDTPSGCDSPKGDREDQKSKCFLH